MRPDNRLWLTASVKVRDQRLNRLDHVPIAQIPRRGATAKHRAVILLGVFHEPCVLLGKEKFVRRALAIATQKLCGLLLYLDQLVDNFVFARFDNSGGGSVTIFLRFLTEVFEARITASRAPRRVGIHFLQIT